MREHVPSLHEFLVHEFLEQNIRQGLQQKTPEPINRISLTPGVVKPRPWKLSWRERNLRAPARKPAQAGKLAGRRL
jgi:hypothetical protein